MDQFIRFPLPIDKSKINWELEYMRHGGSQLIEILEKEFPYEELLLSGTRLGASPNQLQRLQLWIEYNCNVEEMAEKNYLGSETSKSFFWRGAGILAILYKSLDLSPVIQGDQFLSRFSFIGYNIIRNELGFLVISEIEKDKWSCDRPTPYEKSFMTQYFFYDTELNRLQHDHSTARELHDMHVVYKTMMGDQ